MACANTLAPCTSELPEAIPIDRAKAKRCGPHFHLKGSLLAVYDRACRLSAKQERKEYYESNSEAAQALPYHPHTIGDAEKELEKRGWFVLIRSNRQAQREGRRAPSQYRIVPHDEWAQNHAGECKGDAPDRRVKHSTVSPLGPSSETLNGPLSKRRDNVLNKASLELEDSKASPESTSTSTSEQKKKNDHHHDDHE